MNTCEWQLVYPGDDTVIRCTACGTEFSSQALIDVATAEDDNMPNYCPHCGAKTTYPE